MKRLTITLLTLLMSMGAWAGLFGDKEKHKTFYLECEGKKSSYSYKGDVGGPLTDAKMRIMMRDAFKEGYIRSVSMTANAPVYLKKVYISDDTIQFRTKRFSGGRKTLGAIDRKTGEITWKASKRFEFNGVCSEVKPWSPDDSIELQYSIPEEEKKF